MKISMHLKKLLKNIRIKKNNLLPLFLLSFLFFNIDYAKADNFIVNPYNFYRTAALAQNSSALFYNSAGVALSQDFNTYLNLSYGPNGNQNFSLAFNFLIGTFGFQDFSYLQDNYKIYQYALPGQINLFGQSFFFSIDNKWYTINSYHPYSIGLDFLTTFLNHFSFGAVFDNINQQSIFIDSSHATLKKYSLGAGFFHNRLLLSVENLFRDNFDYKNNIYQSIFELIPGLPMFINYYHLQDEKKMMFGVKLNFPNLGIGYYQFNNNNYNNNYEFSINTKRNRTIFSVPGKIAEINISGLLTDVDQYSFLGEISTGAQRIIRNLDKCYQDDSITGVILYIDGIQTTSYGGIGGLVYEIRDKLEQLRKKNKLIVAYLEEGGSTEEYYLASAANRIVMPVTANLSEVGVAVKTLKIKNVLDKLGLGMDIVKSGKMKTTEAFFSENLSEEQLKRIDGSVADSFDLFIDTVAKSRIIEKTNVIALIDKSPILDADLLKQEKWIDVIGYKDKARLEMAILLNKKEIPDFQMINIEDTEYLKEDWKESPKVAILYIYGEINSGVTVYNPINGSYATGADSIVAALNDIQSDPSIKAVILRIDSPGGSVVASDEIYNAILNVKNKGKYVVASFGSMAASGGYYISCAADYIVSSPYTITGSIGVFAMKLQLEGLFKKYEVQTPTAKRGKYSDTFAYDRKFTDDERKKIQESMTKTHLRFKDVVHTGRKISMGELDDVADGGIYTGHEAKDLNLVDQLGGMKEALQVVKRKIKDNNPILVYYWKDYKSLAPIQMGSMGSLSKLLQLLY